METRSLTVLALCVAASAEPLYETLVTQKPLRPLQRALKDRSDQFNAYANEYTQEYEPMAFAAIPLGGPVPIIAVLSENPITQAKQLQQALASSLKQIYAKPDFQQNHVPNDYSPYTNEEYQKTYEYPKYKPYVTEYPKHYSSIEFSKPYPPVEYPKPYPLEYTKPYPVEYTKPFSAEYAPYRSAEYSKPYPEEYLKPHSSADAPTILYARPNENGGYTYSRRPLKKKPLKRPRKQKPVILRVHKYRVVRSRRSGYEKNEN